jgi:hypothetical protein
VIRISTAQPPFSGYDDSHLPEFVPAGPKVLAAQIGRVFFNGRATASAEAANRIR